MNKLIKGCIDRIKTNFQKNKKILLIFLVVWVVTVIITLFSYSNSLGKQSWGNDWCDSVVELNENTIVEQRLSISNENDYDDFDSVCVKFATYARKNNGNITIKVEGCNTNTIYLTETFDVDSVIDNDYRVFDFIETLNSKKDNQINIKIISDSKEGEGAGLYYSSSIEFDGNLYINNEEYEGSLSTRFLTSSESLGNFCVKTISWMCVGFSLLILFALLVEPKPEILFPIIIFIFGLVFMVVIIPLSPPDEQYHYECSLQLSNMILGQSDTHTVVNKAYVNYSHFYGHYNISNGYIRFLRDINEPLDLSSHDFTITSDIEGVYYAYFVPQTIGVTIARLLGVNMLRTFYAGRLTNLIFYCICIYIAIKNTPVYKMLFGVVASMPIFIQTAASMSYDCFVIALFVLILSFFFKWNFGNNKIAWYEYLFVLLCCLGIANAKYIYSFLIILFFLVPKERFGGLFKKIVMCSILCYSGMYALLPMITERLGRIISNLFKYYFDIDILIKEEMSIYNTISSESGFGTDGFEGYGMSYFSRYPLETIDIFYRTIRYGIKTWFYNALGRTLSGNTLILPISFAYAMVMLVFTVAFRAEEYVPSLMVKVVTVLIAVIIGLLVLVGFFLTWTDQNQEIIKDYGGIIIQGVQGRYFSPLIPCFMTIFNNKKLKISEKFDKYIIFALILLTFEVVIYVLSYTFVN